ncbi:hypothetical protein [Qipengyuania zhejiangensis]|uniref:hypothetical protein n=1 Tax=Qipengyuania zhejiangensis TaxID=3077782 RepID=UPI002D767018|nr:hypothetical protein [Qipengyuania sp. Z2]
MTGTGSKRWRVFFRVAAAYNLVIGLGAFLDAAWGSPEAVSGVLVFCFGLVYALVGNDPRRYAPMVIAGIVGKSMVVAMLGPPNWAAGGDAAIGAIVAGDLVFTIGFIIFLWRNRTHA